MLDINLIRENKQLIEKKLKDKNVDLANFVQILELDEKYRKLNQQLETLNYERNKQSSLISQMIANKEEPKKIDDVKKQVSTIKTEIEKISKDVETYSEQIKKILLTTPNVCDDSVPVGRDENENLEIKKYLKPREFTFAPKPHWDLAEELNLFLADVATKITGARFITYYDQGARLYRALQQFTLDMNIKNNFVEVLPQAIVNETSLFGSGQLPKFEEDLFKLQDLNYYLSPTAEVQLTNIYRDQIIDNKLLPIKLTANTPCFRSEAGSAGRDTRGAIRLHQFHKTELMVYAKPEKSYEMLEEITRAAESVLEALELPYRRIVLCTGDTGFSSAKTYDIEVWLPSYNAYKEISSCSNCTDFQARRARIRYKDEQGNNRFVHTLNGSSLAIDRLWVAVVENYQNVDGSITIPRVLQPYMNNQIKIEKK